MARKRRFRWIPMKSRLLRAARETLKYKIVAAVVLWMRRETIRNQSINQPRDQRNANQIYFQISLMFLKPK